MSKELADRIVALGVLYGTGDLHTNPVHPYAFGKKANGYAIEYYKTAEAALSDGRVVLALMEKLSAVEVWRIFEREGIKQNNKPIDRIAIATACCEALEQ